MRRLNARSRQTSKQSGSHARRTRSLRSLALESLESREMLSGTPLSFYAVDDAAANVAYHYAADGAQPGSAPLASANAAPRGVASAVGSDKTWVIDANRNVYVYGVGNALLGSWSAGSL